MTIAAGARALGVSERAVRRRVERGTLESRREEDGNRVRTLVRVGPPHANPHGGADPGEGQGAAVVRLARVEERLAVSEAAKAELRRELAEVKAERDRLLALVERLVDERRPLWAEVRAWVIRRLRGER